MPWEMGIAEMSYCITQKVKKLTKTEAKRYSVCRLRTQTTNKRKAEFIYGTIISLAHVMIRHGFLSVLLLLLSRNHSKMSMQYRIKMENRFMKCSTRNMRICSSLRNKRRNNSALRYDNEHRRAFMATNELSSFLASMNNNAQHDRSTNFLELEVNVPRTIGILRDDLSARVFLTSLNMLKLSQSNQMGKALKWAKYIVYLSLFCFVFFT